MKPEGTKGLEEDLVSVLNSCVEGYTGEWDPSGEGRDGFMDMYDVLVRIAESLQINISKARKFD